KVGQDDDLWIVGDFACDPNRKRNTGCTYSSASFQGARRQLVVGNHDGHLTQALPWNSVSWLHEVNDPAADRPVTLCHYPMMTWKYGRPGALHLFGHVHGNWEGAANSVNVGVDEWDFYPITAQDAA